MGEKWVVSAAIGCGALLSMVLGFGCESSGPKPLYDRLGGETMIQVVVEDFVGRASGDPRVNFTRKGTGAGMESNPGERREAQIASGGVSRCRDGRAGDISRARHEERACGHANHQHGIRCHRGGPGSLAGEVRRAGHGTRGGPGHRRGNAAGYRGAEVKTGRWFAFNNDSMEFSEECSCGAGAGSLR